MKMAKLCRLNILLLLMFSVTELVVPDEMDLPDMTHWVHPDHFFEESKPVISSVPHQRHGSNNKKHSETESLPEQKLVNQEGESSTEPEYSTQSLPEQKLVSQTGESSERRTETEYPECNKIDYILYLKRFVNVLLKSLNLDRAPDDVEIHEPNPLKLTVTKEQLQILRSFGSGDGDTSVRQVDDTVTTILGTSSYIPDFSGFQMPSFSQLNYAFYATKPHLYVPIVCLIWMVFHHSSPARSFLTMMLIIFITSYYSTGMYLVQQAEISQYIAAKKYKDVGHDCIPGKNWWFRGDDCEAFIKSEMEDPTLKVTGSLILSVMLSEFWGQQLASLGFSIAKFYAGFGELSFLQQLLVTPLATVILCFLFTLLIISITGGTLRLPMFIGSISFSRFSNQVVEDVSMRPSVNNVHAVEDISTRPSSNNVTSQPIQFHFTFNQPSAPVHSSAPEIVPCLPQNAVQSTCQTDVNCGKCSGLAQSSSSTKALPSCIKSKSNIRRGSQTVRESTQKCLSSQIGPCTSKKRKRESLGFPFGSDIARFSGCGDGISENVFHFRGKGGLQESDFVRAGGEGDHVELKCNTSPHSS